jgi:hypothetical protein
MRPITDSFMVSREKLAFIVGRWAFPEGLTRSFGISKWASGAGQQASRSAGGGSCGVPHRQHRPPTRPAALPSPTFQTQPQLTSPQTHLQMPTACPYRPLLPSAAGSGETECTVLLAFGLIAIRTLAPLLGLQRL